MKTKKEKKQTKAEAVEALKAKLPSLKGLTGKALKTELSKLTEKERELYQEAADTLAVKASISKDTLKLVEASQKRMTYRKEIAKRDKELQFSLAETLVKELKLSGKSVAEINKQAKLLKLATGTTRNQGGALKRECGFKPVKDAVTGSITWERMTSADKASFVEAKKDKADWKHKLAALGF